MKPETLKKIRIDLWDVKRYRYLAALLRASYEEAKRKGGGCPASPGVSEARYRYWLWRDYCDEHGIDPYPG